MNYCKHLFVELLLKEYLVNVLSMHLSTPNLYFMHEALGLCSSLPELKQSLCRCWLCTATHRDKLQTFFANKHDPSEEM